MDACFSSSNFFARSLVSNFYQSLFLLIVSVYEIKNETTEYAGRKIEIELKGIYSPRSSIHRNYKNKTKTTTEKLVQDGT